MNLHNLRFFVIGLVGASLMSPMMALASVSAPGNLSITGSVYTNDKTPTFTWSAPSGATWYEYALDYGSYASLGNTLSYTLSTTSDGFHTFSLRAHNNYNEVSSSASLTFEIDTVGPTVPQVAPSTAEVEKVVTLYTQPSGEAQVLSCTLYINNQNIGVMTKDGSRFEHDYIFLTSGNYTTYAACLDGDGNTTVGATRTMTISGSGSIEQGDLIKSTCPAGSLVSDPCRAVYYYGSDGKSHAFPNESVYYGWYSNFNDVVEISNNVLSAILLGDNVTYRPGTVLVKFDSSRAVYALSEGAILHAYISEYYAQADWGSSWQGYIRLVPDSLFGNYAIGSDINETSDYDRTSAYNAVADLDDNF